MATFSDDGWGCSPPKPVVQRSEPFKLSSGSVSVHSQHKSSYQNTSIEHSSIPVEENHIERRTLSDIPCSVSSMPHLPATQLAETSDFAKPADVKDAHPTQITTSAVPVQQFEASRVNEEIIKEFHLHLVQLTSLFGQSLVNLAAEYNEKLQ